ncbi:MAG: hypothetical protein ACQEWV_30735 [Bacillota bacterium]
MKRFFWKVTHGFINLGNSKQRPKGHINQERGMTMNKKWFFMLTGIFLSAMMLLGCNLNPDPAPPEEDQNQVDEDLNDTNDLNGDTENDNLPGVDEDDNMFKDDEEDADPDPEDPIEDPEDIGDKDNKDE